MELKTKVRHSLRGIVVTWLRWKRLISCGLLGVSAIPVTVQRHRAVEEPGQFKVIQVREPDGQILTYSDLSRPTEVSLGGTSLAREARIKLKIQSASGSSSLLPFIRKRRPGFLEIDINRGNIAGLQPAQRFGKDFLTYVLWAVSAGWESVEPRRNQFGGPKTHQHQREDALPGFLAHGDCGTRLRGGRSEPAGGSL